jgi:hypothetical protein
VILAIWSDLRIQVCIHMLDEKVISYYLKYGCTQDIG